ncbi:hypothetical protein V6N11_012586 [Hibiscus sabdariffa]|uniref:RNase H type-1 domain-containing protein n=1 Tax=Hibiscus sabdariffa TaxID=183260 RepID=A0ABR2QBP8_9ROSI
MVLFTRILRWALLVVSFATVTGHRLAWDHGFERIQLQIDCVEAFKLLSSPLARSSDSSLVCAIVCIIQRSWIVDFAILQREANFAADTLVKLPAYDDGFVEIFMDPLFVCVIVLSRDLNGPTYNRY